MRHSSDDVAAVWYKGSPFSSRTRPDIETTGIEPATDAIIEIASADMVRGGGITNAIDTLVRPCKPIPPGASAVHHVAGEDVQNAPAFSDVIHRFKGADYYLTEWGEAERSLHAVQEIVGLLLREVGDKAREVMMVKCEA